MDKLKFTVWDTINKEWFDYNSCFLATDGTLRFWNMYKKQLETMEENTYIPVRCTSMKDKNGRNIYEGDIIEFNFFKNETETGVIEYYEDMFHIKSLKYKNLSPGNYRLSTLGEKSKIIGNIYENEDLIK